jgi:diaminopropionate ammonia-lyase
MDLKRFPARHAPARRRGSFGAGERAILGLDAIGAAWREIASWPDYAPTPLHTLAGLARRLDLGAIRYKDEAGRFGLGSFKALGGAYAVSRLLQGQPDVRNVTVTTATDGNHGRSVAWGAERAGCRCVIYIHEHVSPSREEGIARYGAEMRRVPGGYDDSVRRCAADAAANGWHLVADTSTEGGTEVAAHVMQGYGVLAEEILEQAEGEQPFTHAFVQAGVGGLAAAVAAVLWQRLGPNCPRLIVVEPERADCIFRAVVAGHPVSIEGSTDTFMACLAAGEASPAAWEVLRVTIDDVLALPDEAAAETMRVLAAGQDGDPPIVAGESGCAATAGLIAAALDPDLRRALDLDAASRVLVIGSEGATDPLIYRQTVGRAPEEIARCEPQF